MAGPEGIAPIPRWPTPPAKEEAVASASKPGVFGKPTYRGTIVTSNSTRLAFSSGSLLRVAKTLRTSCLRT